ncbi:hypothetical protein SAMN05216577_111143 [Pseudomonas citronellolis]|uniref:Lmo0937 family membrane protein n=1 Tax=Pseudomonas citronellolis TaxID=53408 RepID=A0AAQ1KFM3_9PSED|nr:MULTISPECIES: lmo0937 family membrane protein [Pseudomonas]MBG4910279.1 lmo0937 family membrane protein [Pseudomonas aeruginosa]SFC85703.1 hypothetical protein SAMN05216577_111143 [Pseudomonas citronellolis]HCF4943864.1 lmo0937 family membrane protein [Pseudomonas aeruginosa]HCF6594800.1 lmo0937 family membrane protein [Pseudomonas aeruginosa]
MLEGIVVVLAALWSLGMMTSHTLGGFIHLLLALALLALVLLIERAPRS